jgi:uncharacterized protein DUF6916
MSTPLTHEEFSKHLNSTFRIRLSPEQTLDARLVEISEHMVSARQDRFAIVFETSNEVLIQQGIAPFEHDQMGDFQLFIVPIGRDEEGTRYEAVFNRVIKK